MAESTTVKKTVKVKVIARRLGYYGMQRHYPAGSGHKNAAQPFLIDVQDFSRKWMKVAPDSRYSLAQVLKMQAEYWEKAPKRPGSLSKDRWSGETEMQEKMESELEEGEVVLEEPGETDPKTMSEAQVKSIPVPTSLSSVKPKAPKPSSGNQSLI
jgi:hypothetical protein